MPDNRTGRDRQWVNNLCEAVNTNCSCGGAGPGEGCAACEVWHLTLSLMGVDSNGDSPGVGAGGK